MKSQILLAVLSASTAMATQALYDQCGGINWKGGKTCASGSTCQVQNPYYSQCLGGSSGGQQGGSSQPPASAIQGGTPPAASSVSAPAPGSPPPASSAAAPASSSTAPSTGGGGGGATNPGACGPATGSKSGLASTTHYYDGQEGACGCGTGGTMASWQTGDGSTIFTAAGSQNLFGGSGSWCGSGCGQCYELTNSGYIAATGQGDCTGAGETITVMITNLCPADGNAQWCSQPADQYGFGAHFDILSQGGPKGWNNPIVSYKPVTCPGSFASDFATCQCASGKTSRARRGLMGADRFYPSF